MTITPRLVIYFIYLIVTFYFGTIFTLLFLNIRFTKKVLLNTLLFSLFSIGLQIFLGLTYSFSTVEQLYPLLVHLPLFIMCRFIFDVPSILSLSSLFFCYFLTSPRYLLGHFISRFISFLPYADVIGKIIATLILSVVIALFIVPAIRKSLNRAKKDIALFFFPLIAIYIFSYGITFYTDLLSNNPNFLLNTLYTIFCCFIFYYLRMYFNTFDEKVELQNKQNLIEYSVSSMENQLIRIEDANEKTRILRHDLRHFCTVIEQYANAGDLDNIHHYIHSIQNDIKEVTIQNYCQNYVVNTILSSYLNPFIENKTKLTLNVNVPTEIFVDNTDLCIILANLLENARHSCEKCEHPFLAISINCSQERMLIDIQNSCNETINFISELPVSTEPGHGYGTKSIVFLVEKYQGVYSFSSINDTFSFNAVLHPIHRQA